MADAPIDAVNRDFRINNQSPEKLVIKINMDVVLSNNPIDAITECLF